MMRIAICDDEKSMGQILEGKVKKLLPDFKWMQTGYSFSGYSDAGKGRNGNCKNCSPEQ